MDSQECVSIPLGGGMVYREGAIPLDECILSPNDTPESIAANRARIKRDSAYERRIWDKAPLSDEEVIAILEGTDSSTVEVNLLERMEKEQRNELCRVILERIEERYRTDVEKINDLSSLAEAVNHIAALRYRALTFCRHYPDALHDFPEVLEKFYQQIRDFNDPKKYDIFKQIFILKFDECKRHMIDSLSEDQIIKLFEFMNEKEYRDDKEEILKNIGHRNLPFLIQQLKQEWR